MSFEYVALFMSLEMTIMYEAIKNTLILGHAWLRWRNFIKITVEEIGWEGRVGASDKLVNMVTKLGVP
jgi:hypothetical protein